MKRFFNVFGIGCLVVLLCISLMAAGCSGGGDTQKKAEDVIKVGFYGPLTGPSSLPGTSSRNGAKLAVDQINKSGGLLGKKVELIEYDDKSSPEQAVKAVTKLIEVDKVNAIVGSLHSGNIIASAPVVEKAKVPEVGIGTSPEWLQKGYKYLFRSLGNSYYGNIGLVEMIKSLGYKTIGVVYRGDQYAKFGSADLIKRLEAAGIKVVGVETFPPGDTDYTGQLTKILSLKPDTMACYADSEEFGPFLKQLRQLGYEGHLFGPEGLSMPDTKRIAGKAADKAIFGESYVLPAKPEEGINDIEKNFLKAYVAAYGEMPHSTTAYRGYDAMMIIAEGIKRSKSLEADKIRDGIESISKDFEGLAGVFDFKGYKGEGIHGVRLYEIKDGKNVYIKTITKDDIKN